MSRPSGPSTCLPHPQPRRRHRGTRVGRQRLPFPLLGLDTDNGPEFLNYDLLAYCEREQLTFTRGRAYRKNDQCFVEQKNGALMRQLVGDDRFAGAAVYRQLTEVYRALRRYVNVFQPSMNLCEKRRDGTSLHRRYDRAQTPRQRFLGDSILAPPAVEHLAALLQALDPVRLRRQLEALLDALRRHVAFVTPVNPAGAHLALIPEPTVGCQRGTCSAPEPTPPFDVTATGRCVTDRRSNTKGRAGGARATTPSPICGS